jgi:hypothetical protein
MYFPYTLSSVPIISPDAEQREEIIQAKVKFKWINKK